MQILKNLGLNCKIKKKKNWTVIFENKKEVELFFVIKYKIWTKSQFLKILGLKCKNNKIG